MSLVLRYAEQDHGIHEKNVIKESFLGFAACGSLEAAGLCETLLTNLDCGIDLLGCVAQWFDGAAVMSERCSGVQSRIRGQSFMCIVLPYIVFSHRRCCTRYS